MLGNAQQGHPVMGAREKSHLDMVSLFIGALSLHYAFLGTSAKLASMAKMIRCTYFLRVLAGSLSRGFERQMTQLAKISGNTPPADCSSNPLHQTHENIKQVVLQKGGVLYDAFKAALAVRMTKLRDAEDHLIEGAITGDDFVFLPTKNVGAIGRRFRAFSHARSKKDETSDVLCWVVDMVPAYASAFGSTALVAVDDLGMFLGGELATFIAKIFSHFDLDIIESAKDSIYLQRALLIITFLYTEYLDFVVDLTFMAMCPTIWLTNNVWFPMVSGMMIALYEEVQELDERAFPRLSENLRQHKASWLSILKLSHERSGRQLGKYDDMLRQVKGGEGMQQVMVENFTSSKRFLEVRRQFLSLMGKTKIREKMLSCLLLIRAAPLTLQTFVSRAVFEASKGAVSKIKPIHLAGSVVDFVGHKCSRNKVELVN